MFGLGAAAKVASTLAMVNDHANVRNRAQLMAFFDLVTFGGLVAGFGAGFLALRAGVSEAIVLGAGGVGVTASVILVRFLVRETEFTPEPQRRTLELLGTVLRNRDIQRLLPVYVPVVALYGYVLSFTDHLIGTGGNTPVSELLIIVGSLGVPLGLSMALSGRLSDRARLRRPFMALGLLCFGGLAILFASTSGPGGAGLGQLAALWPLTAALAAGAGMFPPAALAYLGDIVERSVSGTSFGVYSIIFGSGLIIGPILGGALTERLGSLAFAVLALGFIGVSATGVAFIREPAKAAPAASAKASGPPHRD
jgi:MFS family permease